MKFGQKEGMCNVSFDLQKVLPLSDSNINSTYYSRQVYIYNTGISILSKGYNKTIFILGGV